MQIDESVGQQPPLMLSADLLQRIMNFLPPQRVLLLREVCVLWNTTITERWHSTGIDLDSLRDSQVRVFLPLMRCWWDRTMANLKTLVCARELRWPISYLVDWLLLAEQTLETLSIVCVVRRAPLEEVPSFAETDPEDACRSQCSPLSLSGFNAVSAGRCCACWSSSAVFFPRLTSLKVLVWRLRDISVSNRLQYVNPPLLPPECMPKLERIRLTRRGWQTLAQHHPGWYEPVEEGRQIREMDVVGTSWDRVRLSVFREAPKLHVTHIHIGRLGDLRSLLDTCLAVLVLSSMRTRVPSISLLPGNTVGVPFRDWEAWQHIKEYFLRNILSAVETEPRDLVFSEAYYEESFLRAYWEQRRWTETLLPLVTAYTTGDRSVLECADACSAIIKRFCPFDCSVL